MSGDALARGAKSAQFSTGGKAVTQKQWDEIFAAPKKKKPKRRVKRCPAKQ
jgi:hypothetical protein